MKRKAAFFLGMTVLLVAGLITPSSAETYHKWAEFTIIKITEPAPGSRVPVNNTITLKCVPALDVDILTPCAHPEQLVDSPTFTWSANAGAFLDSSGTEATWTAPATIGPATITVSVDDDSAATVYANDVNRNHSVTIEVIGADNVYVKWNAPGQTHNGQSWATAYLDLNTAITNAPADSNLWVAAGTYKPSDWTGIAINKNVKIYGGFAGTETGIDQRDWVANVTILSGDIGVEGNDSDNSHHVVNFTSAATLDGFTLTKGRGWSDGAGAYVTDCSPTIRNCTFTDNFTSTEDGDGGGIQCWNSDATVVRCVFLANAAGDDGGGAANKSGSDAKYINCAFYDNEALGDDGKGDGGAVYNAGSEANPVASCPTFINCVMANNSTQRYGGAVALQQNTTPASVATYLNCTFYGNVAGTAGDVVSSRQNTTTYLKSCILWNNNTDGGTDDIYNDTATTTVTYSDVQGNPSVPNHNINSDPYFANTDDLDGPDDRWLTCDDGLRIKFNSPCVDAADGNAKDAYTEAGANERDALGLKHIDIRTVADTGTGTPAWYDMGACEAAVEHFIFVSVDGWAAKHLQHDTLMGSPYSWVMPNLKKMKNEGLWTYEARSDHDYTETTPNHITMLTGRPVVATIDGNEARPHRWTYNGDITNDTWTLHGETSGTPEGDQGNENLTYLPSVYDIVHDRGGTTAEYAGKDKFLIHEWSWDLDHGRTDLVTPPDEGRDKIDTFEWTPDGRCNLDPQSLWDYNSNVLMSKFISDGKAEYPFNFVFLHLKGPDKVGHNCYTFDYWPWGPWDSSGWDDIVKTVDGHLGTLITLVTTQSNKEWYYNTVIVVTADHGGGNSDNPFQHDNATEANNFTIPFFVWGSLIPGGDAYAHSGGTRVEPAANTRVPYAFDEEGKLDDQPIRHADGVDLALNLMGMRSIPGATIRGMSIR